MFLDNFLTIGQQVLVLFILIAVGLFQRDFSMETLGNIGIAALTAGVIIGASIVLCRLVFRSKDINRKKVLQFAVIFSNCGFMSLPLQKQLLGDDGWFFGSIFVAMFNIIVWTYGLVDMSGDKKQLSIKKIALNPGIIGAVAAIILFVLPFQLPPIIAQPITHLSNLNTPVPMLIIGYYLSKANFRKAFTDGGAYLASLFRLIIIPFAAAFAMLALHLDKTMVIAFTIASAAPTAATTTMFAAKFNRDVELSVSVAHHHAADRFYNMEYRVKEFAMPKSSNQKQKLLYLQKILLEKTDEEHALTMTELIDELKSYDIQASRKSIYDDMEILQNFGLDICRIRSHTTRYYIGNRDFQVAELKLLVDAIQSSKFITQKKSLELIAKLEHLVSEHQGKQLQRQVTITNRVKTVNERIYYNVDQLHNAISANRQISFTYFRWEVDFDSPQRFRKVARKNGAPYIVQAADNDATIANVAFVSGTDLPEGPATEPTIAEVEGLEAYVVTTQGVTSYRNARNLELADAIGNTYHILRIIHLNGGEWERFACYGICYDASDCLSDLCVRCQAEACQRNYQEYNSLCHSISLLFYFC